MSRCLSLLFFKRSDIHFFDGLALYSHLPFLCPYHFPRIRDMNNAIKDDNEIRFSFIKKKRFSWLITWSSHPSYWSTIRWRWQRPRQVFTLFENTSKKSHCERWNWNFYLVWNIFHDFKQCKVEAILTWCHMIFCTNSVRRFRRCMYTIVACSEEQLGQTRFTAKLQQLQFSDDTQQAFCLLST